jgi:FkbM family methyltransferase
MPVRATDVTAALSVWTRATITSVSPGSSRATAHAQHSRIKSNFTSLSQRNSNNAGDDADSRDDGLYRLMYRGSAFPFTSPSPMIQPLRRALKRTAKRFGYEVVPSAWMPSAVFAEHLRDLFARLAIDCVLDVGANRGQYRDFLRTFVGYRGRIISFEPIPEHVRFLRESAASDPLWEICGCALGADDTTKALNVMEVDTFSSFLTPDHGGVPQFSHENVVDYVQTVDVRRLDAVLPELRQRFAFESVYLKMDTQGFDLRVIEGAGTELGRIRALQTELALRKLYKDMPGYEEVLPVLTARGFDISSVFVVSADDCLRAIECDLVMVNRVLPIVPRSAH